MNEADPRAGLPTYADDRTAEAAEAAIEITVDNTASPSRVILHIAGEVDMLTVPLLRQAALEQLEAHITELVFDLGGVSFIGSLGLGALVELSQTAKDAGISLRLISDNRQVLRPLSVTGLDQVLPVSPSLAELPPLP